MSTAESSEYYTKDEIVQIGLFAVIGTVLLALARFAITYWADNTDQFASLNEAGVYLFFLLIAISVIIALAGYMLVQVAWFLANVMVYYILNILLGETERHA